LEQGEDLACGFGMLAPKAKHSERTTSRAGMLRVVAAANHKVKSLSFPYSTRRTVGTNSTVQNCPRTLNSFHSKASLPLRNPKAFIVDTEPHKCDFS
jgi:hypothetical protein